jgi:hypothetical protein
MAFVRIGGLRMMSLNMTFQAVAARSAAARTAGGASDTPAQLA